MTRTTKSLAVFIFIFLHSTCFSANISSSVRREYALKFHEAFLLQSIGQSSQAFYSLQSAFQQGTRVGESPQKLQAIADMFYWYRKYGAHLKLFAQNPVGDQIIGDAYTGNNCKYHTMKKHHRSTQQKTPSNLPSSPETYSLGDIPNYSGWAKNPKQASQIRNMMFGLGEIISAVFIFCASNPVVGWTALPTIGYDGVTRMFEALNDLWTDHEVEMYELKALADRAAQLSQQ
jgi:hypothetical protein